MQSADKIYTIKTPDDTVISFKYISRKRSQELLSDNNYELLPDDKLDFFRRKAYLLADQKILYEIQVDGYCFLIDNIENYMLLLKGKKYFQAGFIIDKENYELYPSFNLRPSAAKEYFDNKINLLNKYPMYDGYHVYLMPDSSVAFLRHRINDIFDGYWYPSIQVFEHEYYFLTNDRNSPDPKL